MTKKFLWSIGTIISTVTIAGIAGAIVASTKNDLDNNKDDSQWEKIPRTHTHKKLFTGVDFKITTPNITAKPKELNSSTFILSAASKSDWNNLITNSIDLTALISEIKNRNYKDVEFYGYADKISSQSAIWWLQNALHNIDNTINGPTTNRPHEIVEKTIINLDRYEFSFISAGTLNNAEYKLQVKDSNGNILPSWTVPAGLRVGYDNVDTKEIHLSIYTQILSTDSIFELPLWENLKPILYEYETIIENGLNSVTYIPVLT